MRPHPHRDCDCPHGYPLCCCHHGLPWDLTLRASNRASSLAGWPAPRLDPEAVARHRAEVAEMRPDIAAAGARRRLAARIADCPHRGPVLPVPDQAECGCAELSECRAGKGAVAGRVTTADCIACVGGPAAMGA